MFKSLGRVANTPLMRKALWALLLGLILSQTTWAQSLQLNLGGSEGTMTGRVLHLLILMTVIALAPSLLIIVTSFTRIIIVLSFLRSAIGLQQSPPNMVLIALSLFLTFFIMGPTFEKTYKESITPLIEQKISEDEAFKRGVGPFHRFMLAQTREKDIGLFIDLAKLETIKKPEETPLRVLLPAFLISELRRAFEIGFLLFIPFLIIDMVVSSLLMAMGMMMLPPVMISLPFKLIFFVLIDGWHLLAGSLVKGFHLT